ncbi:unnamed protein product [Arctia plantaginis]|uniref:Uncharacterized protein n=1 Tax=Arctia plantaginis TaxID=874455 RepID=A0A8S0ZT31_ARCPL|nr:unnamed protein product [Arctia plantaginis]
MDNLMARGSLKIDARVDRCYYVWCSILTQLWIFSIGIVQQLEDHRHHFHQENRHLIPLRRCSISPASSTRQIRLNTTIGRNALA